MKNQTAITTTSTTMNSGYTFAGYTCTTCGAWVCSGSTHFCVVSQPTYWNYYWPVNMDKTEKALEIVKMLRDKKVVKFESIDKFLELVAEVKARL